jgi:nucleoid-associated protein YgaU
MKSGFITKRKSVDVEGGKEAHLDVELDRGREIHGRTVDRQGSAVAGARVQVTSPSAHFVNGGITDSDGQFTISGLEDGRYRITAQKNGFVNATAEDVDPASGNSIVLTFDRGGTITGRVTGVPDAELPTLRVNAAAGTTSASSMVNADGTFTLSGIADGRVVVTAYAPFPRNRQSRPQTVEVVNGTAEPVLIDFAEGVTVRGRVTREGVAVTSGNVGFVAIGGVYASRNGAIGGDGMYEVSGLDPGDYDIVVRVENGTNDQGNFTVSGSTTHDIDLRGGSIQGVVLDASTAAPLPGVRVSVVPPPKNTRLFRTVLSDSDGHFSLDLMPDGAIDIRAEREHYASATTTVTVSGGTAPPVQLRMEKGSEAAVRIVDAQSGAGIDGYVSLMDANNHGIASGMSRGEDGATHVWAAPGDYRASVSADGYLAQSVNVTVPGPEVRVPLMRAARLLIRSKSGGLFRVVPTTAPSPGAGGTVGAGFLITPGNQLFSNLAPGPCEVDLLGGDRKTVVQKYNVVLIAGQTTTLDAD